MLLYTIQVGEFGKNQSLEAFTLMAMIFWALFLTAVFTSLSWSQNPHQNPAYRLQWALRALVASFAVVLAGIALLILLSLGLSEMMTQFGRSVSPETILLSGIVVGICLTAFLCALWPFLRKFFK